MERDKNLLLLFYMWISSFPRTTSKRYLLSNVYCWLVCQKSGVCVCVVFISGSFILLHWSTYLVSVLVLCCLCYNGLMILFDIRYGDEYSKNYFLLRIALTLHMFIFIWILRYFSISMKNGIGILMLMALSL